MAHQLMANRLMVGAAKCAVARPNDHASSASKSAFPYATGTNALIGDRIVHIFVSFDARYR